MVVAVGDITGSDKVDVDPSDPVHDHAVALLETACKFTVPPLHIGPPFIGTADGVGFTVTIVVVTVVGLQPDAALLLTVNE